MFLISPRFSRSFISRKGTGRGHHKPMDTEYHRAELIIKRKRPTLQLPPPPHLLSKSKRLAFPTNICLPTIFCSCRICQRGLRRKTCGRCLKRTSFFIFSLSIHLTVRVREEGASSECVSASPGDRSSVLSASRQIQGMGAGR